MRIILIGGGGHARVVEATARQAGLTLAGYTDPAGPQAVKAIWLGDDSSVFQYEPGEVLLLNGVGSVGDSSRRRRVVEALEARGYRFEAVIHPDSSVASDAQIGRGTVICAGAVVQAGVRVGRHCIINTGAVVDHDCRLGDHVHVAPSATLCGDVTADDSVHVGAGATVIQGVRLGAGCIVGAGALVRVDVSPSVTVVGVPARVVTGSL